MKSINNCTIKRQSFLDSVLGLNLRCVNCGVENFSDYCLCEKCGKALPIITGKTCEKCGCAIYGDNNFCTSCAEYSQYYANAYSVCEYTDIAKSMVYKLKFGNKSYIAKTMAQQMANVLIRKNIEYDCVVYVPVSKKTLKTRGFNQSYLLSRHICDIINEPLVVDALIKIKDTISQEKLTRLERFENVKNCFELNKQVANDIKGKTVLLVDDVKTSGATVNECSRLLAKAKTKEIKVITFASVKQSFVFD